MMRRRTAHAWIGATALLVAGACGSTSGERRKPAELPEPEPVQSAPGQTPAEAPEPEATAPAQPETDPEGDAQAGQGDGRLVVGDDPCEKDADCVPARCCHAAACVARANAPDCQGAMCTQECRYGTIDCGGGCLCHEGRCAARLSDAPGLQTK